jgi:hypothetical protein
MAVPIYLTVNQLVQKQPCLTIGGVRMWIFHEEKNGLKQSGAIMRIGKKLIIDEDKFFAWLMTRGAN